MLPVARRNPGRYPPSDRFAQFGDDLLGHSLGAAHDKLAQKKRALAPWHLDRLAHAGLLPPRPHMDTGSQAFPDTHEIATGPDAPYVPPDPQPHGPGAVEGAMEGAGVGVRHGFRAGQAVGYGLGSVGMGALGLTIGAVRGIAGALSTPRENEQETREQSPPPSPRTTPAPASSSSAVPPYLLDAEERAAAARPRLSFLQKERNRIRNEGEATGVDPLHPFRKWGK